MLRDGPCPLSDFGRGHLWRRHNEEFSIRDELGNGNRDITGAGRKIEKQNIKITPKNVGKELLDSAVQHRTAPHDRGVALNKVADGDHLDAMRLRRHDHVIHLVGAVVRPQHSGDRVAVNIGIQHPDIQPLRGQRSGNIDRHRRLTDASLAGGDGVHARVAIRLTKRNLRLVDATAGLFPQLAALLVVHDIRGDGNGPNTLDALDRRARIVDKLIFHGATGDGEINLRRNISAVDGDRFHHA